MIETEDEICIANIEIAAESSEGEPPWRSTNQTTFVFN